MAVSFREIDAFYDHMTTCIIPGPRSLSYFAFALLLPGALLIPPSVLSHRQLASIFLPLIIACELHAWQASAALDVISTTVLQWSFVLLVCYDPRRDFRRVHWEKALSEGSEGAGDLMVRKEEVYPDRNFVKRLWWVLTLVISIRLTGWKIGNLSHDRKQSILPNASRTSFLRHALGLFLLSYVLLDISGYYSHQDPYFTTSTMDVDAALPINALQGPGAVVQRTLSYLPPRLVRSTIIASQIYGFIAGGFYPVTFPIVALNVLGVIPDEWSPHTWPRFFGAFSVVRRRGLRGLWGSWWHQMNRQIDATPGKLLADHTGLVEGSMSRSMVVTTVAFGLSGWMHMGMIPPSPNSRLMTPSEMRLSVAAFFWIQPLGFAFEDLMTALYRRISHIKMSAVADVVVLLWVACWLSWTLPMLTAPFRELGYWTIYPVPFSFLNGLAGSGWSTWSRSTVGGL